jgi:nucleoside-diphosphate-sugar epimerase
MKIFLTGATGFIGWELCKRLLSEGYEVNALCRNLAKTTHMEGLKWVEGSLEDAASVRAAMEGCSQVYHCGALARVWDADPGAFYRVNVEGTENVLDAARYHNVEKLVMTSTAGVIGKSLSTAMTEDDPRLEPFDNDYDLTKFLAEEKVLAYAKEGRWAVIVSPSRVYGPGNESPSNAITNTLKRYLKQPFYMVPGDGNQQCNYVFVGDVVAGHIKAINQGTSGEKYILGGENVSYNQLFKCFEAVSGLRRRRISVPQGLFSFVATILVGWSNLSGQPPLVTPFYARRLFHSRMLSTQKAETRLGYQITPLMTGLAITLQSLGFEKKVSMAEGLLAATSYKN